MDNMRNPVLGEELYVRETGNVARYDGGVGYFGTVTKIGRKYFTVAFNSRTDGIQFHIDTWVEKSNCSANYILHESHSHWMDEQNREIYRHAMREAFDWANSKHYTLEQYRKVSKTLNLDVEEKS